MKDVNQLRLVSEKTQLLLRNIIDNNTVDEGEMTEDAVWYIGTTARCLHRDEMQAHLKTYFIDLPTDTPEFSYTNIDYMNDEIISVAGKIEYHADYTENNLIKITFFANWTSFGDEWKLKQLITTSRRDEDRDNKMRPDTLIDLDVLYDSVPVGIMCCVNDEGYPIQFLNYNMCSIVGFESVVEYIRKCGESALAIVHSEDIEAFMECIRAVNRDGFAESKPFRLRKKDFSYVWVRGVCTLVQDRWIVFSCIDHTEQKEEIDEVSKGYERSKNQNAIYETMINNMPVGFHRCALFEPVHVDFVSDSLCSMCGYSREEIFEDLKSIYLNLVVPEDHHVIINAVKSLMAYPHSMRIRYRIKRKDGSTAPVVDAIRSSRDSNGRMWAYSAVWYSNGIQDSHNRMDKLAKELPCGFAEYRYDGKKLKLLHLNDEYAAPSGYKTPMYQEIASQNAFAFLSEDDITQLEWQLNHISAGASEFECTVSVNGKRGPVIVNLSLFFELNEDGDYLIRVYSKETEDLPLRTTVTQKQVATPKPHRVEIRTFGYFELFVDEKPVYLKSAKAREMLAVLVDRRGGFVSPSSIISNLWENESANKVTLTRCRKTFKTLTDELKAYGIDDIVESHNGQRRIVPEKVKCDYFEYNTGKPQYQYLFKGSYLTEYSWAETTLAELMMAKEG